MDLNKRIAELLKTPWQSEEFTEIFSLDKNWNAVDKSIKVPKGTQMSEIECPECLEQLRVLYDAFDTSDRKFQVTCPHCKEKVNFKSSFTGYTADLNIDYDV